MSSFLETPGMAMGGLIGLISFGLFIVGIVIALVAQWGSGRLHRGRYIFLLGLLSMLFVVIAVVAPLLEMAGNSLSIAPYLAIVGIGACHGAISRMRAEDIYGSPARGWYCIVPFVNFVLVFKAPQQPEEPDVPIGSWLRYAPGGIPGGVLGVALILVTNVMSGAVQHDLEQNPFRFASGKTLAKLFVENFPGKSDLPKKVSNGLTWLDVHAEGDTVVYRYRTADHTGDDLRLGFYENSFKDVCSGYTGKAISRGMKQRYTYVDASGSVLFDVIVGKAECASNPVPAVLAEIMAKGASEGTPTRVDELTTLTGARASGPVLIYEYQVPMKLAARLRQGNIERFKQTIRKNTCKSVLTEAMGEGLRVRSEYYDPKKKLAASVETSLQDCSQ